MDELKEVVEEVAKDVAESTAVVIKNYISAIIAHSLKPTVQGALMDMLEDTKDALGKGSQELKDTMPFECKGVDEPELFKLSMEDYPIIHPYYNNSYVSYKNLCVRIGKKKNGRGMLNLCRKYQIRWGQWYKLQDKIQEEYKEQKDMKLPVLPDEYLLGSYCCCMERKWEPDHGSRMKAWADELQKAVPQSKQLPAHFYMGDDYENQQKMKAVFDDAFSKSKYELVIRAGYGWYWELPPFDEGDAIVLILKARSRRFVDRIVGKLPNVPGRWRLEWQASSTINTAIETGFNAAWGPAQKAIDEVKGGIQKIISDGGAALVNQLKPLLAKIVEIAKSKMADEKDDEKEAKEEEKKPEIGDVAAKWKLEKTGLGQQFDQKLADEKAAGDAIPHFKAHWQGELKEVFEVQIAAAAESALGGKMAKMALVKGIIKGMAKHIVRVIKNFSTIDEFIAAAEPMLAIRQTLENDLVANKDNKETCQQLISTASSNMWKTLPDACINLFRAIEVVKARVRSEARSDGLCDEALDAMEETADHLFEVQMRALNALRVMFTNTLREDIAAAAQENDIRAAVRNAFRKNLFILANAVTTEAWTKIAEAITEVTRQCVLEVFRKDIAPAIEEPIKALADLMPEPLKQLDVVSLAFSVCDTMITKAVKAAMTKLFLALEVKLFTQA